MLPTWIKVSQSGFDEIKSKITEGKEKKLKTTVNGKEMTLDGAKRLVKGIASGAINKDEAEKHSTTL